MGNNFKFLLEYYQYIDNIDNNTSNDIYIYNEIKKRTKFGKLSLMEGLIYTYPIDKSIRILVKRFPELKIETESDGELFIVGFNDKLNKYLPFITNLGYFISNITIDGDTWIIDYNDTIIPMAIYIEPIYDYQITNIPNLLYHASPLKFKLKILKYGLSPRSGNKLSRHPDRIYMTEDINSAISFGNYLNKIDNNMWYKNGYCIYSINGVSLNKLYSDINFREGGYYTVDNIAPEHISLIKEIKF